jgi:hypothetical protein
MKHSSNYPTNPPTTPRPGVSPDAEVLPEEQGVYDLLRVIAPKLTLHDLEVVYGGAPWFEGLSAPIGRQLDPCPTGTIFGKMAIKPIATVPTVPLNRVPVKPEHVLHQLNGVSVLKDGPITAAAMISPSGHSPDGEAKDRWVHDVRFDPATTLPYLLMMGLLNKGVTSANGKLLKPELAPKYRSEGTAMVMGQATAVCDLLRGIESALRIGFKLKWELNHARPLEYSAYIAGHLPDAEMSEDDLALIEEFKGTQTYRRHVRRYGERKVIVSPYSEGHPPHPTLPSGHAIIGRAAYRMFQHIFVLDEELDTLLKDWGSLIGYARVGGGIHFPMDITYGQAVADAAVERMFPTT